MGKYNGHKITFVFNKPIPDFLFKDTQTRQFDNVLDLKIKVKHISKLLSIKVFKVLKPILKFLNNMQKT